MVSTSGMYTIHKYTHLHIHLLKAATTKAAIEQAANPTTCLGVFLTLTQELAAVRYAGGACYGSVWNYVYKYENAQAHLSVRDADVPPPLLTRTHTPLLGAQAIKKY